MSYVIYKRTPDENSSYFLNKKKNIDMTILTVINKKMHIMNIGELRNNFYLYRYLYFIYRMYIYIDILYYVFSRMKVKYKKL